VVIGKIVTEKSKRRVIYNNSEKKSLPAAGYH
jgi:hypothetical protein